MTRVHAIFGLFGVAAVVVLGVVTGDYWAGLLTQGYTFAILAITADVLWGLTGILTFGSSAMFGIGAYTIGAFFVHGAFGPWTVALAIPVALVIAALVSLALGWLVFYTRGKIGPYYVSLVTLGVSVVFQQIAVYGGKLTGGSNGLSGFQVGLLAPRGWYWVAAASLAVVLSVAITVARSDFGLVLRAIKDHETRCRYLGMDTSWVKVLTFAACNMVACLAGCLYALHTTVVAPSLVDFLLATNVLIWVTLGGKGSLIGPVLVAIAINVGAPTLNTLFPLYWQGILGLVFVIAVVALPDGLLPALAVLAGRALGRAGATGRKDVGVVPSYATIVSPGRTARPASKDAILEVTDLGKRYGSFAALKSISFAVRRGELVSIVGPNGAGKTSLIRCISDGLDRSHGEVSIDRHPIGKLPPERIVGLGLGRKFQGGSVFPGLSVADCILIASWKGRLPPLLRRSRTIPANGPVAAVVERMGLGTVWAERAGEISHGQRQALELAMVLALDPDLLLLDEPTAGLSEHERREIGVVFRALITDHDLAIVLIEHDFEFVKEISTRMLVLHDGRILADGSVEDVSASDLVRDVYLGRQLRVA